MATRKETKMGGAVKGLCIFLLLIQQMLPVIHATELGEIKLAQVSTEELSNNDIDLDPPAVSHVLVKTGTAGAMQSFTLTVIDTQGIHSVMLMVREGSQDEYQPVAMQSVVGTDNYNASVETNADQKQLEYYFVVVDTGGNKVLNGFPYEPFERFLEAPVVEPSISIADSPQVEPVVDPIAGVAEPQQGNKNLLVWGAIGLVVVGVLAASSGGSSGGNGSGDGSGDGAGTDTVPVTVIVPLPQ